MLYAVVGKGDPPASSTSKADAQKERELDEKLINPLPLPPHLDEHERRASRVNVDVSPALPLLHSFHKFLKFDTADPVCRHTY
jgi:hypothetical protein